MMSLRSFRPTILASLAAFGIVLAARAQLGSTPNDNLNLRYANGIVAIAEDKVITVDDVRREIGPLISEIQLNRFLFGGSGAVPATPQAQSDGGLMLPYPMTPPEKAKIRADVQ